MKTESTERTETCRDRVGRVERTLNECQVLLDDLIAPTVAESKRMEADVDGVVGSLESKLDLLGDKADYLLDQLQRLSGRI
jgi:hypothetical protein